MITGNIVRMAAGNAVKAPILNEVKVAKAKMTFLNVMNALHKTKMFGKNKSEPLWKIFRKHPITRGMASYLVIWPTGNIIQQTLCKGEDEKIDWWKVMRFGLYGCFITAPSLYCWVRVATFMYPNTNFRIAMAKALIESITYTPLAAATFLFSMTWLETFNCVEAFAEVRAKFPPTYFTAITVWPLIGTINFAFIPERNRVFFVSCFSLLWTIYLGIVQGAFRNDENESTFSTANVTLIQKILFLKIAITTISNELICTLMS